MTPRFVSERSSPSNGYYFWSYTIDIANQGNETVQLKTRHWRITDAMGRLQEVKGPGVVGRGTNPQAWRVPSSTPAASPCPRRPASCPAVMEW